MAIIDSAKTKTLFTKLQQIKKLTEETDAIKAEIRELLPDGDYAADGLILSVTGKTVLDAAAFAKKYPAAKRPELYKLAPDLPAIRVLLGADEYKKIVAKGTSSVSVKADPKAKK